MAQSRIETLLEALLNGETADIVPQSRNEAYLKAMIEGNTEVAEPHSRIEAYLYALAKNGGTGSGGSSGSGGEEGEKSPLDALIDRTATEISSDTVESVGSYAFGNCKELVDVDLPAATNIEAYAFSGCSALERLVLPLVTSIGYSAIEKCSSLKVADFPMVTYIREYAFYNCSSLVAVILRSTTSANIASSSAFGGSGIAKKTGYIYVPAALVDTYKAATNWSTYADQFRALEDYTGDGTITGELDESKI